MHDLFTSLQSDLLYADSPGTGSRYPHLGSGPLGGWVNIVNAEHYKESGKKKTYLYLMHTRAVACKRQDRVLN